MLDAAKSSDEFAVGVTPDLAAPSLPLLPEFPLEQVVTSLVLYPGAPEELRVRWSLGSDDFVSYGAGFPADGGSPEAVLRLRRLCAEGGSETAQEIRLRLQGLGGDGDAGFRVAGDYEAFEAELGLSSAAGGWLLLARSNRLQHATGIGLEALASLERPMPPLGSLPRTEVSELGGDFAAPARAVDQGRAMRSGSLPSDPVGGRQTEAEAMSGANASPVVALGCQMIGEQVATLPGLSVQTQPQGEGDGNATLTPVRLPSLVYGEPSPIVAGLMVEAELHIRGWAPPNSEIDLFGHPYPVGPGGGFQLVLKVDDAELLKRALDLHLPPEIGNRRRH
ncbi:DUF4912 domain-containing protein [Thiorhodococcus mannitoliphagus]|uniref:DUF4912 domain-containing protein n=1 Tax=Thiorhodococcus mannitoliphagus TaxID=329406 RepID=A0A6P1DW34_9GAMM|nr:DUF4912 domain-containing protein [Thiorhodococcus mannitoliphagus]NEX21690.1 DUF4912 domain-containing protein [Thiorhodococcus mannitoliphagus]